MAPYGYLYFRGLPFCASLPGQQAGDFHVQPATGPKVVTRRGLVFDLNRSAAAAGIQLESPLRHARQICPDLAASSLVEAVYQEGLRGVVSMLFEEVSHLEFDAPNALFVNFAGGGEPVAVLERVGAMPVGFEIVAGLGSSRLAAKAAVLATLAAGTYHRHAMFLPKPEPVTRLIQVTAKSGRVCQGQPLLRLIDLASEDAVSERDFLAALPIGYLWPANFDSRERIHKLGLKKFADLAAIDPRDIGRVMGPEGERLRALAAGRDSSSVPRAYAPHEVVRRLDFDHPLSAKLLLKRSLVALGEDLGRSLSAEGLGCQTLTIGLRLTGEEVFSSRTFSNPKGDPVAIGRAASGLLEAMRLDSEVCGVEVSARGIVQASGEQISFLAKAAGQSQQDSLLKTLSALERKFPGGTVRVGAPQVTRRERMLQLVDPLRRPGGLGAGGASSPQRV